MDESSRDDQLGEGAIVRAGTIDVQRAHSLNDETMKHNHERISCILASQDVVGSAWTGERRSDSGSSASSSRSSRMLTKHSSFPARKNASDREMDITPPTLRAIDSVRLTSPFKARQPFTDKSRLRLDSRRLGGVLSQDHDLLPPPENEESRTSLGGVILSPEGPRSPLSPGGEQHVHHPHQGQRLPKDRSSLVRSATLNRLVQVALAQAESHGIPTDVDAKAALMSLPLSRDFRPESPPEPIVETRAQAASQPLPRTFHVGSPRPASSPNTRRRTGLLSRGRALSSAVEVPGDNADVGEKIMSGRHGPTPTPPAQPNSPFAQTSLSLPPIAQQPLSSKSNQQPSKRSLLARGRLVVSQGSSLVSEPLSFHPPALYGGVKMDSDDPNRLNEELHKLESNTFHSHRLQLPKIHTSRTARLSEGMLEDYIVRNDSFDW